MAYDETLAARIRVVFEKRRDVTERKMFGGLAFMLGGNMCCGIVGDDLMLRIGPDGYDSALDEPHARPMDFTGKPMKGMVYVAPKGVTTGRALSKWIDRAVDFTSSLPKKPTKPRAATGEKKR